MKKIVKFLLGLVGIIVSVLVGKILVAFLKSPSESSFSPKSTDDNLALPIMQSSKTIPPNTSHWNYDRFVTDSEKQDNHMSNKAIFGMLVFSLSLFLFFTVFPISEIQAGCPYRSGSRYRLDCSFADVTYSIAFFAGVVVTGRFIWYRIQQGLWLSKPRPQYSSSKTLSFTTKRYIGLAIIGLLFLISPVLGTTAIFILGGFLAGGAGVIFIRLVIDAINIFRYFLAN